MVRILLLLLTFTGSLAFAQDLKWNAINSSNSELPNQTIKSIAADQDGSLWIGTYMGGIGVFNGTSWTLYSTSNSELPHNYINAIAIDKKNVKWIGTDGGGLARFDGTTWEVYKTSNSGIPSNVVMAIYCDWDGTVWIGTYFGGLAHFNGDKWTIYNDENSPLLSNKVVSITKDNNDLLWIGTQGGGIASFDGNNWNVYTERNSKLTNDYIYSIIVDKENKKWIGTGGGGINIFNDVYWVIYNTSNSSLTDDNIRPIVIDEKDNKWIGTYIGGINLFDGKTWKVYDFQNSAMPDDEITCMNLYNGRLFIGTERSGVVTIEETIPPMIPLVSEELAINEPTEISPEPEVIAPQISEEMQKTKPEVQLAVATLVAPEPQNRIVLVMDAADIFFDAGKRKEVERAFKYLLKNRIMINETYEVKLLVYSTNFDVSPRKIVFTESELESLSVQEVVYLDGESSFTDGIKKAYNIIRQDYLIDGNNHVMAATYKFIKDDETAKVVIKDNLDNNYIVFSLLAFDTESWKLESKMRDMIPRGNGYYYSINKPGIKDNWSVTGQLGVSLFRGDIDVQKKIGIPGVFGFAANKQVLSTGILNGGIKAQFNIGQLKGEKNNESFKNNYIEGCLNFQVILNKWFNRNFRFDKYRPYGFAGIGFINYRVLLRNENGEVVNGYGYDVVEGDIESNGMDPAKTKPATDLMFPVGAGVNYKINEKLNLELEMSSRFINSDKLDAKVRYKNDKYWFFSVGVTYKLQSKEFLSDILSK